jgi:hypothetical protein
MLYTETYKVDVSEGPLAKREWVSSAGGSTIVNRMLMAA